MLASNQFWFTRLNKIWSTCLTQIWQIPNLAKLTLTLHPVAWPFLTRPRHVSSTRSYKQSTEGVAVIMVPQQPCTAKQFYPDSSISIVAMRDYVKHCNTGVKGLASRTLSLKPTTYRRTVGVGHVADIPTDKHGNNCVIMVVEQFSHFPLVYAAKDYTAETVATVFFKRCCHHGTFEQLVSDPGSAFMSDVVKQLNAWLNIYHNVSLVGRHEPNGTECQICQCHNCQI